MRRLGKRAVLPGLCFLLRFVRGTVAGPLPAPEQGSIRAVTYNLYLGGLDGDSDERFRAQVKVLADLQPDVLALQECNRWDENEERRLLWVAHELGMEIVAMVRSGVGDGRNFTVLLYRPSKLWLVGRRIRGLGVFHHAMILARLRPVDAGGDVSRDFLAFGTHLTYTDGETRLREARWFTDYAGEFPGVPPRAMLLMDKNEPGRWDRRPWRWSKIPQNMWSRYRFVRSNGRFGGIDRRATKVLLNSGWIEPESLTGRRRKATVGYYYRNERVPWRLDHILVRGLPVSSYVTLDTPELRLLADHLPVVLDTEVER